MERYPDLSILQVDAHADMRKSYDGNAYSHASVSYHLYKMLPTPALTNVGVRNISQEEVEWLEQEQPNVKIFWASPTHLSCSRRGVEKLAFCFCMLLFSPAKKFHRVGW